MWRQAKEIGTRGLPFILFILLGLLLWQGLFLNPHLLPAARIGQLVPQFETPLLGDEGNLTPLALKGRMVLLNVWASWCTSCAEEQVVLLRLARKGVPIVGLNYKDNPLQAKAWLKRWGNPYQVIGQDLEGKVAMDFGVYGTPETFVIDQDGRIVYRHAGVLTQALWEKEIAAYFHA